MSRKLESGHAPNFARLDPCTRKDLAKAYCLKAASLHPEKAGGRQLLCAVDTAHDRRLFAPISSKTQHTQTPHPPKLRACGEPWPSGRPGAQEEAHRAFRRKAAEAHPDQGGTRAKCDPIVDAHDRLIAQTTAQAAGLSDWFLQQCSSSSFRKFLFQISIFQFRFEPS